MTYGDGGIVLRSDGRLQVTVWIEGRPRYRMVPRRLVERDPRAAKRLAERYRRELVDQRDADFDPAGQTLAVYLRSWLAGVESRGQVRPRTIDAYRLAVENHLIPALGTRRLDRLTPLHIQAWLDADPHAAQTKHHYRGVLRRALSVAVRQRTLPYNAADPIELPPLPEYAGQPFTVEEARAFLSAARADRLFPLWRLALATGLRLSELLGLARDDVDPDQHLVTVRHALQRRAGQWSLVPPKAARRVETLSIDAGTAEALRRHLVAMAAERRPEWRYHGLLFVTPSGEPYAATTVRRAFRRACAAAGIGHRRIHDLRGSSATLLADLGVAEDVRQARLGHATKRMARRYAAPSASQDRDAAERLGEALG